MLHKSWVVRLEVLPASNVHHLLDLQLCHLASKDLGRGEKSALNGKFLLMPCL